MSVGIDFISYNILSFVLNIDLSTSKAISFILGSSNSYLLNKSITFKSKKKSFKEIIKFIAVYTFSLTVNYFIHKYFLTITSGYIPFHERFALFFAPDPVFCAFGAEGGGAIVCQRHTGYGGRSLSLP